MKPYKTLFAIVFVFIQVAFVQQVMAQELEKDYNQIYDIESDTEVKIANRYGEVRINNWDKEQVEFKVHVTVKGRNEKKSQKAMDKIIITFSQEGNVVSAETDIDGSISNTDIQINYEVNMPKNLNLDLVNKYGPVFIDELTGKYQIAVKYGTLKANKLMSADTKPRSHITLGYSGKCKIEECTWLKLTMKYSGLTIDKAKAIAAVSKYSKLKINEIKAFVAQSKYDGYRFGRINTLSAEAKYSSIKIDELSGRLKLDVSYTGCKVSHLKSTFNAVDIQTRYGGIKIAVDKTTNYALKADVTYGKVKFPDGGDIKKNISNHKNTYIEGTFGGETPKSKINIVSKYGGIKITNDVDKNTEEEDEE